MQEHKKMNDLEVNNKDYIEMWREVPGDLDDFIFYKGKDDEICDRQDRR